MPDAVPDDPHDREIRNEDVEVPHVAGRTASRRIGELPAHEGQHRARCVRQQERDEHGCLDLLLVASDPGAASHGCHRTTAWEPWPRDVDHGGGAGCARGVACRLITRRRVPGVLLLGATALTVRSIIAFGSGSVFVYFLQPTLGTIAVAAAFLLSVPAGRPLAERLAADFCPLPQSLLANPAMRRFFMRISLLWALTNMLNAAVTIWLLVSQDLAIYLLAKTFVSWTLTASAIVISTVWFKRS